MPLMQSLRPSKSLFARFLWATVGLSIFVAVGAGVLNARLAYSESLAGVAASQRAVARIASVTLDATMLPLESDLKRYASLPWAEFTDGWQTRESELTRLLARHAAILRIKATSNEGRSLVLAKGDRVRRETNSSGPATEQSTSIATKGAIQYAGIEYVGNVPNLTLSINDVLSSSTQTELTLDMRFVGDSLRAALLAARDADAVMVLDDEGRIIAHTDPSMSLQRAKIAGDGSSHEWLVRARQQMETPLARVRAADGGFSFVSALRVERLRWLIVAEQSSDSAMRPVERALLWTVGAAILGASIAAYLAWVLVSRLTKPVKLLQLGASAMARGELSQHLPVHSNDELGALAEAFNSMSTELQASYLDLEKKVAEKTSALASTNAALQVASRHKNEFLAHMSHELRTPLNAVIGFSDLLKAQYFGPLNQKQSEYVRDINASGQHLLSLINDILDLAKVEAGRMELVLSDANVPALVESCVALVSERVSRNRQSLTTELAADVGAWQLDERKVKQCLLNLLTNASKFTPGGGAIALRVWIENNALVAAVSDNGVGIAEADLPKLFSEFYQAKVADDAAGVSAQREGTGLGLALTKGFVELHGGTISVKSAVGKGSTFTMRFPRPLLDGERGRFDGLSGNGANAGAPV